LTDKKVESMDATDVESIIVRAKKSILDFKRIENDDDMNVVQNSRNYIKRVLKRVDELFDPIIVKIRDSLKTSREQKALLADPLMDTDRFYATKLSVYLTEKVKKKEEDERKIREEEARRKRKLEKKFGEAAKLENEGKKDQAHAVMEEVEEIEEKLEEKAPVPIAPELQHGHMREQWSAEVIKESIIPRKYWNLDLALLNRTARAQKDKMRIPGVKAVKRMIPVDSQR